jgi:hypothetical protein
VEFKKLISKHMKLQKRHGDLLCSYKELMDSYVFVNLNYAYSCVLVISYPFHVIFMQICMCECLKIIGVYFLVNMLSLKKLDVPILETRCSSFCGFADKTG